MRILILDQVLTHRMGIMATIAEAITTTVIVLDPVLARQKGCVAVMAGATVMPILVLDQVLSHHCVANIAGAILAKVVLDQALSHRKGRITGLAGAMTVGVPDRALTCTVVREGEVKILILDIGMNISGVTGGAIREADHVRGLHTRGTTLF